MKIQCYSETISNWTEHFNFVFLMTALLGRLVKLFELVHEDSFELSIDSFDEVCAFFSVLLRLRIFGGEGSSHEKLFCDFCIRSFSVSSFPSSESLGAVCLGSVGMVQCRSRNIELEWSGEISITPFWWSTVAMPFQNGNLVLFCQRAS